MRNLILSIGVCLMVCTSGCATSGGSSSEFSLFQSSATRNQPFRDCIRNWFRGDECNTCNAPAGLPANCNSNVAPLCDQFGSQFGQGQPAFSSAPIQQPIEQGVQLYSDPNLNVGTPIYSGAPINEGTIVNSGTPTDFGAPSIVTPDISSNLIDPVFDQGNLGIPTGAVQSNPVEAGYGEIPISPSF